MYCMYIKKNKNGDICQNFQEFFKFSSISKLCVDKRQCVQVSGILKLVCCTYILVHMYNMMNTRKNKAC